MNIKLLSLFLLFALGAGLAHAGEEEGASAEKKKPVPKPDAGAAIVSILQLPVIKEWKQSVEAQGGGVSLAIWGEDIQEVKGHSCWGINVGKTSENRTRLWKRFYVAEDGSAIWVESTPSNPAENVVYFTYEEWVTQCHPARDSLGDC